MDLMLSNFITDDGPVLEKVSGADFVCDFVKFTPNYIVSEKEERDRNG